ncbi:MAG: outer membrane beta-barrel protein [Salinibacter sp.]
MRPRSLSSAVHVLAALALSGVVFAATPTATTAQPEIEPGVQVGVTSTTHGGNPASPIVGRRRGLTAGVFATVDFAGPFALRPELNFTQKGTRYRDGGDQRAPVRTFDLSYVELPVLASVEFSRWGRVTPVLFGGPALGLRVGTGEHRHDLDRRTVVSVVVGSGVDVRVGEGPLEALSIDARYQMGVRRVPYRYTFGPNLPAFETGTFRNRGVVVTLGVSF